MCAPFVDKPERAVRCAGICNERMIKKLVASDMSLATNWCGRRDLNPYPLGHAPQTCAYAYSATTADAKLIIRYPGGFVKGRSGAPQKIPGVGPRETEHLPAVRLARARNLRYSILMYRIHAI